MARSHDQKCLYLSASKHTGVEKQDCRAAKIRFRTWKTSEDYSIPHTALPNAYKITELKRIVLHAVHCPSGHTRIRYPAHLLHICAPRPIPASHKSTYTRQIHRHSSLHPCLYCERRSACSPTLRS